MFEIAHLTDRRGTFHIHESHFARSEFELCILALGGHDRRTTPGTADHLPPLADLNFDIGDDRPDRNVLQWEAIPHLDRSIRTGEDHLTNLHPFGREHIPLLPVDIMDERDERGTVRILFDRGDPPWNIEFVHLEIHQPIPPLVPTTLVTDRNLPMRTTTLLVERCEERFLRLAIGQHVWLHDGHVATSRIIFPIDFDCHIGSLLFRYAADPDLNISMVSPFLSFTIAFFTFACMPIVRPNARLREGTVMVWTASTWTP